MMPIVFSKAQLNQEESIKQRSARKQMQELMERLVDGEKYRTLTQKDRKMLLSEGYAKELVDNMVFITQRITISGLENDKEQDKLVTGFTYAAFDSSLYACESLCSHSSGLTQGHCAFCESPLDVTDSGQLVQFRPAATLSEQKNTLRSPYFDLAYQQNNLVYSCRACHEHYKRDYFPVKGDRFPEVAIERVHY